MTHHCEIVPVNQLESAFREAEETWPEILHRLNQTRDWYLTYIQALDLVNWVRVLQVTDNTGQLTGLLPLELRHRRGTRFWKLRDFVELSRGPSDFFSLLIASRVETEVTKALVNWFVKHPLMWETIQLSTIPASSAGWSEFVEAFREAGLPTTVTTDRAFYKIDTTGDWGQYEREFLHKRLADMRNRRNRLERDGYSYELVNVTHNISEYLPALFHHYDIRRKMLGQRYATESQAMQDFVREVVSKYETRRSVVLSLLIERGGDIMAYQLDWVFNGIRYHWKPTFDLKYERYSPSKILLFLTIRDAFYDPSIREFNFMRGESTYKTQFAKDSEDYISIKVTNPYSLRFRGQTLASKIARARDVLLR
jgi:CelD/BcsL family acetyltransferase involved in cellulose biosynthesis